MAQIETTYLNDIVVRASERTDTDYKRWLDLNDAMTKAKLARHIAALANHGGGYIVLGVEDNGSRSAAPGWDLAGYNNDWINAIAGKYLAPPPECEIRDVVDAAGLVKVILVPSHGAVPICAKANGPEKDGRIQGIRKGAYYTRAVGPQSVEIADPEAWRPIIHRCVINERDGLLGSIGRLFSQPTPNVASGPDIRELLEKAADEWRALEFPQSKVNPKEAFATYSFQLYADETRPTPLLLSELKSALGVASEHAEEATRLGWAVFDRFIDGTEPTVALWDDCEALRQVSIGDDAPRFWLASADGRGTESRVFHEDTSWLTSAVKQKRGSDAWEEGLYFSPNLQAIRILQLVYFVTEFSRSFAGITRIDIGVSIQGLENRRLKEPRLGTGYAPGRRSAVNGRSSVWSGTPEQLIGSGAYTVAAKLISPFTILFDGFEVDAIRVERFLQSMKN